MTAQSGKLTLEIKRVLPAARPVVFRAFTAPDELARWWGPDGFTVPSLEFNPRAGDSYRIEMQPPEGDPFYLTGAFREVDPPARLAYTFEWEDPDPDDVETLVELSFGISTSRRRSSSLRAPSRPRPGASSTGAAGRKASTSSSSSSRSHSRGAQASWSAVREPSALGSPTAETARGSVTWTSRIQPKAEFDRLMATTGENLEAMQAAS